MNFIYGAGGHGKVVLDALIRINKHPHAFIDDKPINTWAHMPVLSPESIPLDAQLHLAIGNSTARELLAKKLQAYRFFSIIHPQSSIAASAQVSDCGTFVAAQAVVGPETIIGEHCIINHAAVVDHDCNIGNFCHIAPGSILGGGVQLGQHVLIGSGAVILPGIRVADHVTIGAGAVVTKNIIDACVVTGVPAKPHRLKKSER